MLAHLAIENTRERRTIQNVIGVLRGTDEPAQQILLSNHHDAWVYGAVDPSSGTATMISLARALGALARQGLRPRRTIVFGNWDAEEYTLTGSTEWGEERAADLAQNAVICINVDASSSGRSFSASASPLAFAAIREAAADVADPGASGKSSRRHLARERRRRKRAQLRDAARPKAICPIAILGSGSDYTVFFNHLGIPSVDLVFDGPYGVYHSVYDDYGWMATAGDPGLSLPRRHGALRGRARPAFRQRRRAPLRRRRVRNRDRPLREGAGARGTRRGALPRARGALREASAWSSAAAATQESIAQKLRGGQRGGLDRAAVNAWLLSLERGLLDPQGLPRRPWFRHLDLCAPALLRGGDPAGDSRGGRSPATLRRASGHRALPEQLGRLQRGRPRGRRGRAGRARRHPAAPRRQSSSARSPTPSAAPTTAP